MKSCFDGRAAEPGLFEYGAGRGIGDLTPALSEGEGGKAGDGPMLYLDNLKY